MKAIRNFLILVLVFVVVATIYYTVDRYIINDGVKGISPKDIINSCLFLILPISAALYFIKKSGKTIKKRKK